MKKVVALALGAALLAALLFSMLVVVGCGSQESPSALIDKSMQKSKDTKTKHLDYDVKLDIKGDASALGPELKGMLPFSLGISGGVDIDNRSDKAKAQGNIKFSGLDKIFQALGGSESGLDAQTTLGVSMVGSLLSDMEFKLLDEKMYLKMGGSWYETDASSAGSAAGVGGLTSGVSGMDQGCIQSAIQDPNKFGSGKIMTDIQEVGDEKINGTDTRHLKANLDLDKTLTEMANILRECGDAESAGGLESGKAELSKMFKSKSIEMWIDKDANLLQVKVDVELDPAAISETAGALSGADTSSASGLESIAISLKLTISDLNKEMNISKPDGNILKLEDLFGGSGLGSSILGGGSGTSTTGGTSTSTTGGTSTRSSTSSQNTSSY
ncbi:MAG: LolA-like protein [Thermoleophilia bacterium]